MEKAHGKPGLEEATTTAEEEAAKLAAAARLERYRALNQYSSEQFDRMVLYIASGSLGVSITFIDKIINLEDAEYKWLLFTAWVSFAATVIIFLLNHYLAIKTTNDAIRTFYFKTHKKRDKLNKWVKELNVSMIFLLLIGLFTFITFIIINL